MATMVQTQVIREPMLDMQPSDLPSPSTQFATFLSNAVLPVGKDEELATETTVEISQPETPEERSEPLLTRDEAIQILVDGQQDIEDAIAKATELAILEELEDFEPFPAAAPAYQDNIIHMHTDSAYNLTSATFEIEETAIPEGSDPCNVFQVGSTLQYDNNKGKIEFLCGRSPSREVAQWWSDKVTNSSGDAPSLNFAFTGLLTLTLYGESLQEGADRIVLPDFGLAQGYTSSGSLTWLFGSADGEADKEQTIKCTGWSSAWGNLIQAHFRQPTSATDKVELVRIEYL